MKKNYEVHVRAVKTKVPTADGSVVMYRGAVVTDPTDELIELAKADKNNSTYALIPAKKSRGKKDLADETEETSTIKE